ncbi:MAG TPA: hypothetical protein VFN56_03875 [Candidatus Saccharimonadales bacterium]|nr:hypothetical protein [Candidatus Saccharimonadales bacterium]
MSEVNNGGESYIDLEQAKLDMLAMQTYREVAQWLEPPRVRREVSHRPIKVQTGVYTQYYGKPAAIKHEGSDRTLLFDEVTFDDLSEKFVNVYGVEEEEVARLYMGTGIVMDLMWQRIRNTPPGRVKTLIEMFGLPAAPNPVEPDMLADAIRRADDVFSKREMEDLIESTIYMDETQRILTNSLRFAVGLLFSKMDEKLSLRDDKIPLELLLPDSNLTQLCRIGLQEQLARKPSYLKMAHVLLSNPEIAQKIFADGFSELEMAAAFPMGRRELQTVLRLLKLLP